MLFIEHYTRTILVVGLLIFATVQQAVLAQETTANGSDEPKCRTWTDRSGKHRTEATFIEVKDGKATLKKINGTIIHVPLNSLSDADQRYIHTVTQEPPLSQRGNDKVAVAPEARSGKQTSPPAKEIVVTGVGTDPDKAVQDAFSQAIEQTVGVLVDAETVVKNDQLIRDEVLTYSRGYVEKYEIVKRWQEADLYHATIRAVVAREKLVARLREIKIAVLDVPGDRASRQIEFDVKNDSQAAEMLKKAIADFDMTKLSKAEITGDPEIIREGTHAKVRIKAKVSPDLGRWRTFSQTIQSVLTRTSVRHAKVTAASSGLTCGFGFADHVDFKSLRQQLKGDGILVSLLAGISNADGSHAEWVAYRVPETMGKPLKDAARKEYRLAYKLLDKEGQTVSCEYAPIECHLFHVHRVPFEDHVPSDLTMHFGADRWHESQWWWVGPIWFRGYPDWVTFYDDEHTVEVSLQELRRIGKVQVAVEEEPQNRGYSDSGPPMSPFAGHDPASHLHSPRNHLPQVSPPLSRGRETVSRPTPLPHTGAATMTPPIEDVATRRATGGRQGELWKPFGSIGLVGMLVGGVVGLVYGLSKHSAAKALLFPVAGSAIGFVAAVVVVILVAFWIAAAVIALAAAILGACLRGG